MNKNKIFTKIAKSNKRFAKMLVSFSMVLSMCSGIPLPEKVNAEDVKQTFSIEGTDDGTNIGRYFSVDSERIGAHVIKGADDSIAYCLSHYLKFPNPTGSENPTIYSKSSDDTEGWSWTMAGGVQPTQAQVNLVQRALYAGYPTKTPAELGISSNSERAAYYATQAAIWTILQGWGDRVQKLEGANAEENQMIDEMYNAYKKIMTFVNSNETGFSSQFLITDTNSNFQEVKSLTLTKSGNYKESQALTVRPAQRDAYSQDKQTGISFSVGFEGDVPEGAKIVDSNGNECYDFGQGSEHGTVFKVRLPANSSYNGTFKVVVDASVVRNAPLIWNTANTAYQTLMQFGAVQASGEAELSVSNKGVALGTVTFNKVAQQPAGTVGTYSDENYTKADGVQGALLVNQLKYAYLPLKGVQFSVYYKNDTGDHFANEMVGRVTTDANGQAVLNNIELDPNGTVTQLYAKETKAPSGIQLDTDKTYDITLTKQADNTASSVINVSNDAVKAHLTLQKKVEVLDKNRQSTIKNAPSGIQFGVYTNEAALGLAKDSLIKIVETDDSGVIDTGELPLNVSYYLQELKTKDGYVLDKTKYTFNLTANTLLANSVKPLHYYQVTNANGETVESITNYVQKLNLTVNKKIQYVADDGSVKSRDITKDEASKFEFTVYSDKDATNKVGVMTYDETVKGFVLGELDTSKTYYVKETKSPAVYKTSNKIYTMSTNNSTQEIVNELTSGSITITKYDKDSNEKMANIEFKLTGVNTDGKTVITKTVKTDSNGVAKFENLPATIKYTVSETVPSGYKNITGDITADFLTKAASDITKDVYNQEIVEDINIKVIKTNETETVKLSDVTFELYKANNMNKVIAKGKTDANGELRFKGLDKAKYVLVETSTKAHYELPSGENAKTTVDLTNVPDVHTEIVKIKNNSIPLSIKVLKVNGKKAAFGYTANIASVINEGETVQSNVNFKLYKVNNGIQTFIAEGTTDDKGIVTFTNNDAIVYGETYVLKETPVNGYNPLQDLTFTISNEITEDTVYVKAVNEKFSGEINYIKTDGTTTVPMEGVEVKLYKDTTLVATKKTDAQGKIKFDNLEAGNYSVVESKTNTGYVLDTTPQNVVINTDNPSATINFKNYRKKIKINILKTIGNEEKVTVKNETSEEEFNKSDVTLDNVEFSLYEGKTLIAKGKTVDGKLVFESNDIVAGKDYVLKETYTPAGYKAIKDININLNLEDSASYSVVNVKVQNKLIKNAIELYKFDNGTKTPIKNTEITLYKSATGTDESDIVAVSKTDENGVAKFESLVNGTYYLAETKASEGYVLKDMERIKITFDSAEYEVKRVSLGNDRKIIDVEILKQDRDSKKVLQNAGFALYQVVDGVENLVDEGITDENGILKFSNLTVGYMYKLVETRVPNGYTMPTKNFVYFDVPMATSTSTLKLTIDNDKTKVENPEYTKIEVNKVDADNKEVKLANAEFDVYRVVNGQDVFVDKGKTDENGQFVTKDLERGYTYKVVETKQPDGYLAPEKNTTEVNIDANTKDKLVKVTIVNKKATDTVNIKIIKVDADDHKHRLPNAEFSVYKKEEDNKITLISKGKTDENGEMLISGLSKGQTVTILETKAPDGYQIKGLASQDLTIDKDEKEVTIEHICENSKIVTTQPKTGDEDKNIPYYAIVGVAVVGLIAGVSYVVIRKRKENE